MRGFKIFLRCIWQKTISNLNGCVALLSGPCSGKQDWRFGVNQPLSGDAKKYTHIFSKGVGSF